MVFLPQVDFASSASSLTKPVPVFNFSPIASARVMKVGDFADLKKTANREIQAQIWDFAKLRAGWDDGSAKQIGKREIDLALDILKDFDACGIEVHFAAPGVNGEISIELRNASRLLEILVYPHETSFLRFQNKNFISKGMFKLVEIASHIDWLHSSEAQENGITE